MNECPPGIALHGGAGSRPGGDYSKELKHMRGLIEKGRDRLGAGAQALEVAVETVAALEASGLYIAGRGSSPNRNGIYELDASLMDGFSAQAGAVAALRGFASPITVAQAVMQRTPHVLLAGEGAAQFARTAGMAEISDSSSWYTPACQDEAHYLRETLPHGTVGCVTRDIQGRLAAATSTGGVFGKLAGRSGDTPIIGAGTWADRSVAVSCTGQGEYFIRVTAAVQVAHRIRWLGQSLHDATQSVLQEMAGLGGHGGLIAIDANGEVSMPFVSTGMKRAALLRDGSIVAEAF